VPKDSRRAVSWFVRLYQIEDPLDTVLFPEERNWPVHYHSKLWWDVDLLIRILDEAAPDQQETLLDIVPSSRRLMRRGWGPLVATDELRARFDSRE
jgi:hypothetical protein